MSRTLDSKAIGAILLIVGTSIGAGMLALPVANSPSGFLYSSLLLVGIWLLMTVGALCVLEANLWLPSGSSMVSMAEKTLGFAGKAVAWFSFLFLFYSLLASYISGGTDITRNLFMLLGITLPEKLASILITVALGAIVFGGIQIVDYANRGLMTAKIIVYVILAALIAPHIDISLWKQGESNQILTSMTVIITSYGFACIIPSLRIYLNEDTEKLRKVVLIGSLVPLVVYLIWDAVIMGVIPRDSADGLLSILHSKEQISSLITTLSSLLQSPIITEFFRFFTSICMLTAFLGVGISLFDFIADGLKFNRSQTHRLVVAALTFLPPLLIVMTLHNAFIDALAYAGIFVVILLLLLPLLMVWSGRYYLGLPGEAIVKGGRVSLLIAIIITVVVLFIGIKELIY